MAAAPARCTVCTRCGPGRGWSTLTSIPPSRTSGRAKHLAAAADATRGNRREAPTRDIRSRAVINLVTAPTDASRVADRGPAAPPPAGAPTPSRSRGRPGGVPRSLACRRAGPTREAACWRTRESLNRDVISRVPLGRAGSPHEAAAAALFLPSDDAAHVTASQYPADGGLTKHRPGLPPPRKPNVHRRGSTAEAGPRGVTRVELKMWTPTARLTVLISPSHARSGSKAEPNACVAGNSSADPAGRRLLYDQPKAGQQQRRRDDGSGQQRQQPPPAPHRQRRLRPPGDAGLDAGCLAEETSPPPGSGLPGFGGCTATSRTRSFRRERSRSSPAAAVGPPPPARAEPQPPTRGGWPRANSAIHEGARYRRVNTFAPAAARRFLHVDTLVAAEHVRDGLNQTAGPARRR